MTKISANEIFSSDDQQRKRNTNVHKSSCEDFLKLKEKKCRPWRWKLNTHPYRFCLSGPGRETFPKTTRRYRKANANRSFPPRRFFKEFVDGENIWLEEKKRIQSFDLNVWQANVRKIHLVRRMSDWFWWSSFLDLGAAFYFNKKSPTYLFWQWKATKRNQWNKEEKEKRKTKHAEMIGLNSFFL